MALHSRKGKAVERTVTTDATGTYSAPLLPIGNYSIKAEAAGFKTNELTGIVLNAADDLKFNEVIWKSVRGKDSRMPAPVHAAFVFPKPKRDDDDDDDD